MALKLNIGCGNETLPGYVNIDNKPETKADIICDLRAKLPFDDNSVDEIFASHIIEHFWDDERDKLLSECWRVLKPKGFIDIWTVDFDVLVQKYNKNPKDLENFINFRLYSRENDPHHHIYSRESLKRYFGSWRKVEDLPLSKYKLDKTRHIGINMGVRVYK